MLNPDELSRQTLAVVAPRVFEAWPVAMECLRHVLSQAIVDIYPNTETGSLSPRATRQQRAATEALTQIALARVVTAERWSATYRARFSQVELDVSDPGMFALVKDYGPCSIATEIRRPDGQDLLGTWDEGSIMTVVLLDEHECARFLESVLEHNLDPSIFERS